MGSCYGHLEFLAGDLGHSRSVQSSASFVFLIFGFACFRLEDFVYCCNVWAFFVVPFPRGLVPLH